MDDDFSVVVTGEREVSLQFDQLPRNLHDKLAKKITSLTETLAGKIKAAAPDKSGKLRREIETDYRDTPNKIAGYVAVNAENRNDYAIAGALEKGVHGRETVKSHSAHLEHVFSRRLSPPLDVFVATFSRPMDLASRRFMRGPVEAMSGRIVSELEGVVQEVAEDT